ncbi:hypothetical protein MO867_00145 [Microbulbifer sp. OS29]|uniref:Peptidase M15 n=1 Tax=Microbulbifer okhotskensis TaxID=2926617 RepID=A0A9X2EI93_9GAMM|nr:D-Ala-D-Ala carboxypeptidase family metallohydrolase [Microbulbifer okhotskensis]MCO1332734.1 hypothetical protein [Microbulbifer okhotskensis]
MSAGNSFTRFETLYPHKPPGQRVNRVVVGTLILILSAILLALWLFLYFISQEKPYVELKGHRIASEGTFDKFLRSGNNRAQIQALNQFLQERGVVGVFPVQDLLRQGSDWLDLKEAPFAIPPRSQWPNIVSTLTLVRDHVVPLIGPVAVVSAFRSDTYNRKFQGRDSARHRNFCGLDLIPKSNIGHKELKEELTAMHARLGPDSNLGLELTEEILFHIDTCGYRTR